MATAGVCCGSLSGEKTNQIDPNSYFLSYFSRANMGKYGKLWEHDDNPLELNFLRHTHMAKM